MYLLVGLTVLFVIGSYCLLRPAISIASPSMFFVRSNDSIANPEHRRMVEAQEAGIVISSFVGPRLVINKTNHVNLIEFYYVVIMD